MGEEHLVPELQQHQQGQVHQGGALLAHQQAYPPEGNTKHHISIDKTHNEQTYQGKIEESKITRKPANSKCPDKVIKTVLNFPFLNDQLIMYS